jgi:aminopeptidase
MKDPRLSRLARLVMQYSLAVKPRETIVIQGNAIAAPLIRELFRAGLRSGAFVHSEIAISGLSEIFAKEANHEQLTWVSPFELYRARRLDAYVAILGTENTKALSNASPKRLAKAHAAQERLFRIVMQRSAKGELRWVGLQWPCHASAQDAEMSLEEYEDFVYGAVHPDDSNPIRIWRRISQRQKALTDFLNKARTVRIVAEDTDLSFNCKGRKWINCDGHISLPDGEVFTGRVERSVEGHIRFSYPAVYGGRDVAGVRLHFEKGKVVRAEADKGQEYLRAMLSMDPGASYVGEAAIGTNYKISKYVKNTLFDEKIGGTAHLAMGASFPETGGRNRSGLHWDMVCDLRSGGEIVVDGEVVSRNGRFLSNRFPQP